MAQQTTGAQSPGTQLPNTQPANAQPATTQPANKPPPAALYRPADSAPATWSMNSLFQQLLSAGD